MESMSFQRFCENLIETMDEDTKAKTEIDPEKLYYNMVEAKATWLCELPAGCNLTREREETELYRRAEGIRAQSVAIK